MKLECAAMALQLAAADHTTSGLAAPARRHAESCLRCQAELASYRKLKRSLAGLRSVALDTDDAPCQVRVVENVSEFGD